MSNIIQNECESTKLEILIEVARRANWDALHGPMHLKTGRFHIMFNAAALEDTNNTSQHSTLMRRLKKLVA